MRYFSALHWQVAAQRYWPTPEQVAGTTGTAPNKDGSAIGTATTCARTGFMPERGTMHNAIDMIRAGARLPGIMPKTRVTLSAGRRIEVIATTAGTRYRMLAITGIAGITTDMHRQAS